VWAGSLTMSASFRALQTICSKANSTGRRRNGALCDEQHAWRSWTF
jgi:hypothetical protein